MSLYVEPTTEIIVKPVPQLNDIGYAGDGRFFLLNGNSGKAGIVNVHLDYNNSLTEEIDGEQYSKFFCDYFVSKEVKLQSLDLKVGGAGPRDFCSLEVLFLYNTDYDVWVLGKRFVNRFYLSTDFEDQDTPDLPYSKELAAGRFIIRSIYYKHSSNQSDVNFRVNYVLHEVIK